MNTQSAGNRHTPARPLSTARFELDNIVDGQRDPRPFSRPKITRLVSRSFRFRTSYTFTDLFETRRYFQKARFRDDCVRGIDPVAYKSGFRYLTTTRTVRHATAGSRHRRSRGSEPKRTQRSIRIRTGIPFLRRCTRGC